MWILYSRFITVHKLDIHLDSWQHHYARRARILSNMNTIIDDMKTWIMRYKWSPLHFQNMMKSKVIELKARIQSQIQNYEELP